MQCIRRADLHDGSSLALIAQSDGSFAFEYDGRLIQGLTWRADQMQECIDVFEYFVMVHGGERGKTGMTNDETRMTNQ